ncbi:hypothetical protein LEP1GSC168_1089 [Leptospira santarosai str. HAI134]|nr:hypothetical protein LEP1GSC168_1089 [Leptospira santarosai str. HAI134]
MHAELCSSGNTLKLTYIFSMIFLRISSLDLFSFLVFSRERKSSPFCETLNTRQGKRNPNVFFFRADFNLPLVIDDCKSLFKGWVYT